MVEQGAFVVLNSRDEESLKSLVTELKDESSAYVSGNWSDEVAAQILHMARQLRSMRTPLTTMWSMKQQRN